VRVVVCLLAAHSFLIRDDLDSFVVSQSATIAEQSNSNDSIKLEFQKPINRGISTGESQDYVILSERSQYCLLSILGSGIGLRATLYSDTTPVIQTGCSFDFPLSIEWVFGTNVAYRLHLTTCETDLTTGAYEIRVERRRSVSATDNDRVAASTAMIEGERLRLEPEKTANHQAEQKFAEALGRWRLVNDSSRQAEALRNIGEIQFMRGDRKGSRRTFDEALAVSIRARDVREQCRILNDLGLLHALDGSYAKALEACNRALGLSRSNHYPEGEMVALSNIGYTYLEMGESQQGLTYEKSGLLIAEKLKNRKGKAQCLLRAGYAYTTLGEVQSALDSYNRSLPIFRAVHDYEGQALALAAIGHFYSRTGSKQDALSYYGQAMGLVDKMESPSLKAEVYAGQASAYYELGDFQKGVFYYQQTLSLYREMEDPWGQAATHLALGMFSHARGLETEALSHYDEADPIIRSLSSTQLEAYLNSLRGEVYEKLDLRLKALSCYQRAFALTQNKDSRGEALALNHLGSIHLRLNKPREALKYHNQALEITRKIADRFSESMSLANIARVRSESNDLFEAKKSVESAIQIIESLRGNVASGDLRASYFSTVRKTYELYVDILMRLHAQRPSEGFNTTALEVSERARARSLLESLNDEGAHGQKEVDSTLLERERRLGQELDAKAERRMRLLAANNSVDVEDLSREINQLSVEYEEVRAQVRLNSPRYAALTQPSPLSVAQIQSQLLDEDSVLLEFMLGDERSYLWAITRNDVSSFELPDRKRIEEGARSFYKVLTARQPVSGETNEEAQARLVQAQTLMNDETNKLSKLILSPLEKKLIKHRLLIVADGALQYIPFQALTLSSNETDVGDPKATQGTPLIMDHEVVIEPSASALALVITEKSRRQQAPNAVAVFADPVFEADDPRLKSRNVDIQTDPNSNTSELGIAVRSIGFAKGNLHIPRLLASREEAESILRFVPKGTALTNLGFNANRSSVLRPELSKYKIIHFATHGLLNDEHPELSGIVLSLYDKDGKPENGFLRLHDIYDLNLPVDLVVLSACNTGLGKDVIGEGIVGLSRGFMYAGASGVVASLWKVDDEATAEFMKHFYRAMFEGEATPASALRQAQLAMLSQKRWSEPYYWAGFVIQGQYDQKVARGHSISPTQIVAFGLAITSLVIVCYLALKQRLKRNS
jgi:CHAT domain-containing protein/tetratricopeptide (TPR) repeat protein